MNVEQNMALLQDLIRCGNEIYTWCYNADGQLLHSNCPEEDIWGTAFSLFGCKEDMLRHGKENSRPIALGTAFGLIWGVGFEKADGALHRAYVIGPVFFSDVSMKSIEKGFSHYGDIEISLSWKHRFLTALPKLPVAHNIILSRYMLMLHYCLTGEKLDVSDLNFNTVATFETPTAQRRDRHKVWAAEQALLHMVRVGDLNYKSALNNSILISNGVPVQGSEPLRQAKTSLIVFASIICRAAIEGGLSPEEAYSVGDAYIQSVERTTEYSDLVTISPIMYDDFVRRVHKCRTNPKLSKQVQRCCDYIEMHLDEKVQAKDLAALVGYSEYYITRCFKEETGIYINDYIKFAKVERAKVLLTSTEQTVLEISEQLGFSTRSYFSYAFRQVAGCTPIEYRARAK